MHELFQRLDQVDEQPPTALLEGAEIDDLGEHAALAHGVEHLALARLARQPGGVEPPQPRERRVEEQEAPVGAVDLDGRRQALQDRGVGLDVARKVGLGLLVRGDVARDADDFAALPEGLLQNLVDPALAFDDQTARLTHRLTRALRLSCELFCARAHLGRCRGGAFGGRIASDQRGVGRIAPDDAEVRRAPPDRLRRHR